MTAQEILDQLDEGFLSVDEQGLITGLNAWGAKALGVTAAALRGQPLTEYLPQFVAVVTACVRADAPVEKNLGPYAVQARKMQTSHGQRSVLCRFTRSVFSAETTRVSAACQELEQQLASILSASSDGIWICDGQGTVVRLNEASEKLNGILASEVIGRNIRQLVQEHIFDESVTSKVLASGTRQSIVQSVYKNDRLLLCTGTPVHDESGQVMLIVVNERDMTELDSLRRQCAQNRKLTERYREALTDLQQLEQEKQNLVAESREMQHVMRRAHKLAQLDASPLLILGASGTGKGALATFIHHAGSRKEHPFIEINCAALPEHLLEAELFGYEKGAFTGAARGGKVGLIELAEAGTLFLDEIGDMPLSLQAKLLKYLDDGQFRRLGGTRSLQVRCTTLSATNQDLQERVRTGHFREDLFYRLASFTLDIPPLAKRREDIPGLIHHYLRLYNQRYGREMRIGSAALARLQGYPFPGNIRELMHIIENAVVFSDDPLVDTFIITALAAGGEGEDASFAEYLSFTGGLPEALDDLERKILTWQRSQGATTRQMAERLCMSQPTIVRKLKKYQLR